MTTLRMDLTAADVLRDAGPDPAADARRRLLATSAIDTVTRAIGVVGSAARTAVAGEIARVVGGLAGVDLVDLLVAGWRTHRAVRAAAERTIAAPGTEEIVDLATHRISSVHHPSVDVLVDSTTVASIDFELCITLDVSGVATVVRNGRLMSLWGGRCTVKVVLSCEGEQVLERSGDVNVGGVVPLDGGLTLVSEAVRADPPDDSGTGHGPPSSNPGSGGRRSVHAASNWRAAMPTAAV